MMATTNQKYVPGVCNIGQAETRKRFVIGRNALIVCIIFWGLCVVFTVAPPWRLLLFFPATVAAIGFLQSAWHFCAKFGLGGVFNFGPDVGKTDTVEQAEYRSKDRRTALLIIGLSLLIGVVVAAAGYFIPL
jgi:hypothetical protein